jgi:hypothetical protein
MMLSGLWESQGGQTEPAPRKFPVRYGAGFWFVLSDEVSGFQLIVTGTL